MQVNHGNYYHFLIEGIGKLLLFNRNLPDDIPLLVSEAARKHYAQMIEMLGVPESRLVWYNNERRDRRLYLPKVWLIDYRAIGDFNDTWSIYQPPRSVLRLLASTLLNVDRIRSWLAQQTQQ
jgi:hypothetical protein